MTEVLLVGSDRAQRASHASGRLRSHASVWLLRRARERERASGMERPVTGRVMTRASRGAGVPRDPEKCGGDRGDEAPRSGK